MVRYPRFATMTGGRLRAGRGPPKRDGGHRVRQEITPSPTRASFVADADGVQCGPNVSSVTISNLRTIATRSLRKRSRIRLIIASDFCDAGFGRVSHCRCLRSGSSPCSVGALRTQTSAAAVMEFCQRAEKEVERITGTIRSAPPWAPIPPSISHLPHSTWRCKLFYDVVVVQKLGLVTSIRGYRSHTRDTPQSPCQDENTYLQAVGGSV